MADMLTHPVPDQCLAPARTVDEPLHGGRYGRMFPDLEPFDCEEEVLVALGRAGGPCDGGPFAETGDDDAAEVAAGWPVFGQFVAHDITADRSPLALRADPDALENFRTPRANLESLYGAGPVGAPYLYDRDDPARLLTGDGDLTRNAQGIALVGDPRNDVHTLMSQLHLAFLHVHNGIVGRLRAAGVAEADVFEQAQRETTWHYQWVILHEFLPLVAGDELVATLRRDGPRFFRPVHEPAIPLEFADAAYRYGHSQIRHTYRLNAAHDPVPLFPDLVGFRPVPEERRIQWPLLFDHPDAPPAARSKKIDGRLAASLIDLPRAISGEEPGTPRGSLAFRDLQRGQAVGLPSGERIAAAIGAEPLTPVETGLADGGWRGETPLWLYILKEGEARHDGQRLGPVGATIVAEVLLGIIAADPGSFVTTDPDWRPVLPSAGGPEAFGIADLLAFAQAA